MKPYYQDEWVTIYHGDCREIAPGLEWDCLVTDPPYGVGYKYESYVDGFDTWLNTVVPAVTEYIDRSRCAAVCMTPTQAWHFPKPKTVLCWVKLGATTRSPTGGFRSWEPILCYGELPRIYQDVINLPWSAHLNKGLTGLHSCPKPGRLMREIIGRLEPRGCILDPFMGSGSTLVAAKQLNRKAIGIEIEERYCEIAAQRLAQAPLPLGE